MTQNYARVLHSPAFRRLQNKTQLFPGYESDFFRNRLTHSLEVAQIAKTIAHKLKKEYPELDLELDVCEIAGLMHDLGHPPFGHNGEMALDECMSQDGGFEGNAQTLRIITRLEKKECVEPMFDEKGNDRRVGLNLTARVIASALKYDREIPLSREGSELIKGYYLSEKEIVDTIKLRLVGSSNIEEFKTIECAIMDLADDIAYSTYDVEDAFKAGFLTPYEIMAVDDTILEKIAEKLLEKDEIKITVSECRAILWGLFADSWQRSIRDQRQPDIDTDTEEADTEEYEAKTLANFLSSYRDSKNIALDGYMRAELTSRLVSTFVKGIKVELNREYPILSKVYFDEETKRRVSILKHFGYVALINSSRLKVAENRGKEIVKMIFNKLNAPDGDLLLPEDFQRIYSNLKNITHRKRIICDFIAGMTDRYALEFYGRLFSENPQTIFKPL